MVGSGLLWQLIGKNERRYVYSCQVKSGKFQMNIRWHSDSPRDSEGCCTISLFIGLPEPHLKDVEHISTTFLAY